MIKRRTFIASAAAAMMTRPRVALSAGSRITKSIPKTGERIGVIGMGSSITFNVGDDAQARTARTEVLRAFFAAGGGMIDSSPMYGSSEEVIGHGLGQLKPGNRLFSATKVWTSSQDEGREQFDDSRKLWGLGKLDLYQIHNLIGWRGHIKTLLEMKAAGLIRYIGITTSHGRRHDDLENILKTQPLDFVQLSYNAGNRDAERRLLPTAADNGLAVIANRPFQRAWLIDKVSSSPLPSWASEIGCTGWPQVLLKFAVSHPAITTAIPATSQAQHMVENMKAGEGRLPDADLRKRIAAIIDEL
ncbi:MAG: aldo/keto reductase [Rhodospirillaceae bacterium]|jgi:diketogulonate reductase-like aldo/keto reductase|nr:aldo/keto reductase [Rhodospirillaceae bacterium]